MGELVTPRQPLAIKQAHEWCEQIDSPLWPNMNESDWATLVRDVVAEYEIVSNRLADREALVDDIEQLLYGDLYGADRADFLDRLGKINEAVAAAREFVATTSVYRQPKVAREQFERLAWALVALPDEEEHL